MSRSTSATSALGPETVNSLPRTWISTRGNWRSMVRSSSSRGPSRVTIVDVVGDDDGVLADVGMGLPGGRVGGSGLGGMGVSHRGTSLRGRTDLGHTRMPTLTRAASSACGRR